MQLWEQFGWEKSNHKSPHYKKRVVNFSGTSKEKKCIMIVTKQQNLSFITLILTIPFLERKTLATSRHHSLLINSLKQISFIKFWNPQPFNFWQIFIEMFSFLWTLYFYNKNIFFNNFRKCNVFPNSLYLNTKIWKIISRYNYANSDIFRTTMKTEKLVKMNTFMALEYFY